MTAGESVARRPRVDVVVVAFTGGRELLKVCLESISRHPLQGAAMAVWVVDNATEDGTRAMLTDRFPSVKTRRLDHPTSFSAANNVVLRSATAPYVLLLNPDTELLEGALEAALQSLVADPRRAVVGVRLIRANGGFDHAAKRSFPTVVGALAQFTGLGARPGVPPWLAQYRAPATPEHGEGPVDAVSGAFMLVRQAAIQTVGLLDEGYRLYGEDLDWCYRFKHAGWTVWYDGSATVMHVKGATTVKGDAVRYRDLRVNYAFHHAMGRYYRKFNAGERPLLDLLVYIGLAFKFSCSALRSAGARRMG
jgi:GT2 family glycosyltransferase